MTQNVLNPVLYQALRVVFRTVKVSSSGQRFEYHVIRNAKNKKLEIKQVRGGEQYAVCCPYCGDQRFRLEICHRYLTTPDSRCPMLTRNLKCFNEECKEVYSPEFFRPILAAMSGDYDRAILVAQAVEQPPARPVEPVRMPLGCVPLGTLPEQHPACQFIAKKYRGLTARLLSTCYGACWTETYDDSYRLAQNRIIFPIMQKQRLIGWQGRTISPTEQKRWLLSRGFKKCIYNADRIGEDQVPVIAEGITSSICCGPHGAAIFGKTIDDATAQEFGRRWRTAVIATDPETFIPDIRVGGGNRVFATELAELLNRYMRDPVRLIAWPTEFLDRAKRKFAYDRLASEAKKQGRPIPQIVIEPVPDPADVGVDGMQQLLAQVPATHRSVL